VSDLPNFSNLRLTPSAESRLAGHSFDNLPHPRGLLTNCFAEVSQTSLWAACEFLQTCADSCASESVHPSPSAHTPIPWRPAQQARLWFHFIAPFGRPGRQRRRGFLRVPCRPKFRQRYLFGHVIENNCYWHPDADVSIIHPHQVG